MVDLIVTPDLISASRRTVLWYRMPKTGLQVGCLLFRQATIRNVLSYAAKDPGADGG